MKKMCILLALLISLMSVVSVRGEVVNHTEDFICKKNYSYSAANLNSITYGNNMFVAVGRKGAIKISTNGINWEGVKPVSDDINLTKVIWSGNIFIAVGETSKIFTSTNGKDWTSRDLGGTENILDIIWDGKQFIAVACRYLSHRLAVYPVTKYRVLKSKDGLSWSEKIIDLDEGELLYNIVFTGKEYVINSEYYSNDAEKWSKGENNGIIYNCSTASTLLLKINEGEVSTSINGENWSFKGKSAISPDFFFKTIFWDGNKFVGVAKHTNDGIYTSNDGVNWEQSFSEQIEDICWNGKLFVAIGEGTTVFHSSDGFKWIRSYSGMKESLNDIIYNGKKYVAVGGESAGSDWDYGLTISSTDGTKWEMNKNSIDNCLNSVIWDGKKFVAAGGKSVYFSNDSTNWSKASTQEFSFNDIKWNGKIYVAAVSAEVSNSGTIAYSKDCKNWTIKKIGDYEQFNTIAWNGDRFLIVAENKAFVSDDGIGWTVKKLELGENVYIDSPAICIGSEFFINGVFKSKDGLNWSKYTPEKLGKYDSNSVIKNVENNFVKGASYYGGNQYISPDALNWTVLDYDENITGIAYNYNNGNFVAVGSDGTLITLEQKEHENSYHTGIIWNEVENGKYNFDTVSYSPELVSDDFDKEKDNINSIAFNGYTYVAVGDNGIIRTSSDSVKWTTSLSDKKSKLNHVLWSGSKFIAVGDLGTVMESPDGLNWEEYSLLFVELKKVIWDGKKYIIFGENGVMFVSIENNITQISGDENISKESVFQHDGSSNTIQWDMKQIENTISGDFVDVGCNGKNYVAAYGSSLYVSDDLEKWSPVNGVEKAYYYSKLMYYSIMWDGKKYTSAYSQYFGTYRNGDSIYEVDMTRILESDDGINWMVQDQIENLVDSYYLNNNFEVVTNEIEEMHVIEDWDLQCLPGDLSWVERDVGKIKQVNMLVVWNGTSFVLAGKEGAIYTSNDGVNWLNRTTVSTANKMKEQKKIIWDGNKFVLTALSGVYTSLDGIEWSSEIVDKDKFEVVGTDGTVLRVKDFDFKKISPQLADRYSDFYINKNSKGYISVGGGYNNPLGYKSKECGIVLLSSDGENWSSINPEVEGFLRSVVFNKGEYVAVGNNGSIVISKDGIKWDKQNSGVNNNLFDVATNGSIFVVGGEGGIILQSTDGVNWAKVIDDPNLSLYEITWDDISFKAFSDNNSTAAMYWSKDGIKWEASYIDTLYSNHHKSAFACNGDTYIIVTGEDLPMDGSNAIIVGKNYGEKPITVFLDDSKLVFDTLPVIEYGRTMVPMRAIFEAFGAQVLWNEKNKSVTCIKDDKRIVLSIGSNQATLGSESYTLEAVPKIVDGRTLVPLRFISESLGAEVLWDGDRRKVSIVSK